MQAARSGRRVRTINKASSGIASAYAYWVRDTPMPKGNQMPGTCTALSSSANCAARIAVIVTTARIGIEPRRTMRTAISSSKARNPYRSIRVRIVTCITPPATPATASTRVAPSIAREARMPQRFQASVQVTRLIGIQTTCVNQT